MQAQLPEKFAEYSPWIVAAGLAAWRVFESIKKGRKADRDERHEEMDKALLPVTRRADEAERLLDLTEKHLAIETADKLRAQAEVERLKAKLAERDTTLDALSSTLNSVQGRMDELERLTGTKGKTDEGRPRRREPS